MRCAACIGRRFNTLLPNLKLNSKTKAIDKHLKIYSKIHQQQEEATLWGIIEVG